MTGEKGPTKEEGEAAPGPAKPEPAKAVVDEKDATKFEPRPVKPGYARPVMIHRAIIGSFERMIGVLTEHYAGKWPFCTLKIYARSVREKQLTSIRVESKTSACHSSNASGK